MQSLRGSRAQPTLTVKQLFVRLSAQFAGPDSGHQSNFMIECLECTAKEWSWFASFLTPYSALAPIGEHVHSFLVLGALASIKKKAAQHIEKAGTKRKLRLRRDSIETDRLRR